MKNIFLIVGCPRGGTSIVASLLREGGLETVIDTRRHPDYPMGYGEHMPILLFNKMCERLRGSRNRLTDDELIQESFLENEYVRQAFDKAFAPIQKEEIDFVKIPALGLSMHFLLSKFPNLIFIGVVRKPTYAISSFYKREFGRWKTNRDLLNAIGCWNMYTLRLIKFYQIKPERVRLVDVDYLINVSQKPLDKIVRNEFAYKYNSKKLEQVLHKKWNNRTDFFWKMIIYSVEIASFCIKDPRKKYFATSKNYRKFKRLRLI